MPDDHTFLDTAELEPVAFTAKALGLNRTDTPVPDPSGQIEFLWLRPEQIVIDRAYQRRISKSGRAKVARGIKGFDWRIFGAITVVEAGEHRYAVIDGQHRALMAWAVGADRIPAICFAANSADQARAFVGINTARSTVASIDKFRARVASGDEAAIKVQAILDELGISTDVAAGMSLKPHETRAVSKLEKLVKQIGKGLTFTTLEMLRDAQPDQSNLLTAFAIEATAGAVAALTNAPADTDLDRLLRVLEQTDFETLKEEAAQLVKLQGGHTARHGTRQLIRAYNKGLKQRVEI